MRAIFLNAWYGQVYKQFFDFIARYSVNTDVFCLLEVDKNLHKQLEISLNNFTGIESHKNIGEKENYDISIFTSRTLKVENAYINIVKDVSIGDCLVLECEKFVLCGVHGVSRPGNKFDTPGRIKQSGEILNTTKKFIKPVIIGGDFNLMPYTESIKMFEMSGYKNLIKEYNIKNTRNKLCWDQFPDEIAKNGKQYFADYCFSSPGIKVNSFEVPNVEVSDHEPLILDFEV